MTTLIKRYANRKLYNTRTSRYITLKGIAKLIDGDEEVRVIDNETGEDITSITLSQVLVDSERSNPVMSRTVLSDLIQKGGGALYGALKKGVGDASGGLGEFQRSVRRVIRSREEDLHRLAELRDQARSELDTMVEVTVERILKALDLPRRADLEALNQNLERVADALDRLEGLQRDGSSSSHGATPRD